MLVLDHSFFSSMLGFAMLWSDPCPVNPLLTLEALIHFSWALLRSEEHIVAEAEVHSASFASFTYGAYVVKCSQIVYGRMPLHYIDILLYQHCGGLMLLLWRSAINTAWLQSFTRSQLRLGDSILFEVVGWLIVLWLLGLLLITGKLGLHFWY